MAEISPKKFFRKTRGEDISTRLEKEFAQRGVKYIPSTAVYSGRGPRTFLLRGSLRKDLAGIFQEVMRDTKTEGAYYVRGFCVR